MPRRGRVELLVADLAVIAEAQRVVAQVRARCGRLHLLVLDAAVSLGQRVLTRAGIERTFATNHLAPFMLATGLADLLRTSAPARVVVVSSELHRLGCIDVDRLRHGGRRYSGLLAYVASKLANVLFGRRARTASAGHRRTVNSVSPGFVRSTSAADVATAASATC